MHIRVRVGERQRCIGIAVQCICIPTNDPRVAHRVPEVALRGVQAAREHSDRFARQQRREHLRRERHPVAAAHQKLEQRPHGAQDVRVVRVVQVMLVDRLQRSAAQHSRIQHTYTAVT